MADVATPAKTLSTAVVTPQDRGFDSDREYCVNLSFGIATANRSWFPGRQVRITKVTVANGDTLMDTATNTTAVDVDSEDNAGTKVADIAAKAAATSQAADVAVDLTLSTTEADLVIEATETVKAAATIAGTQGEYDVCIWYKDLKVRDVPGDWPAA